MERFAAIRETAGKSVEVAIDFHGRVSPAMAEVYYTQIAPHNPLGPFRLRPAFCWDACCPNVLAQEHSGMPDHRDLGNGFLKTRFQVKNSYIPIPNGPGLDIEVDEAALEALRFDGTWDTPRLFLDDQTMADW